MATPVAYGGGPYGAGTYGLSITSTPGTPQYRIQLRDKTLTPIAELSTFLDGDVVLNFNDVGAFVLTVPASAGTYFIKNMLTANQSDVETDTSGFTAITGATLTRDTTQQWHGAASLKVVTPGVATNEGVGVGRPDTAFQAGQTITASAYLRGAGTLQFKIVRAGVTTYANTTITLTGTWTRYQITATLPYPLPTGTYQLQITTSGTQAVTFYADGLQIEATTPATAWTLGGAIVLAGQGQQNVVTTPLDAFFAAGNGVIISRDRGDGSGAQTLLSGPIWHLERRLQDNVYVLAGPSDDWWLKARRADPGVSPYATVAYDTRTATASTAIRGYVDTNAGPSAPVARRVTGLTLAADPLIGTSVTGNARFDNLLALIQQLAVSGGDIGFRLAQTDVGTLTFTIYQPATQSNAIFSRELGNLLDATYTLDGPAANAYVGAGSGDLTARVFTSGQDATSIATWGLVEGFLDARDTADVPTIGQRITAQLATDAQKTNLTITPVDTAALQFGRDYGLGDIVSVQIDGATITDKIRQLHIQLDGSNQELVSPGIGNAGAGQIAQLFDARTRALANVAQQVARLQAAK